MTAVDVEGAEAQLARWRRRETWDWLGGWDSTRIPQPPRLSLASRWWATFWRRTARQASSIRSRFFFDGARDRRDGLRGRSRGSGPARRGLLACLQNLTQRDRVLAAARAAGLTATPRTIRVGWPAPEVAEACQREDLADLVAADTPPGPTRGGLAAVRKGRWVLGVGWAGTAERCVIAQRSTP